MSLSEMNMIVTLGIFDGKGINVKRVAMSYLDMDIKSYSRILRKLLSRLNLKNEFSLIRWARCINAQKM